MSARSVNQISVSIDYEKSTVATAGETLPFECACKPLVKNKKTGRFGVYLRKGGGAYFEIQPLRKDGTIAKSPRYFTRSSRWDIVGDVEHCVAYSENWFPKNPILRWILQLVRATHVEAFNWVRRMNPWPEADSIPSELSLHFSEVMATKIKK